VHTLPVTHTPLRRDGHTTTDGAQKNALSLLSDITLPTVTDLVSVSDPFLSLILSTSKTSPRITIDKLQPPLALAPDSKKS